MRTYQHTQKQKTQTVWLKQRRGSEGKVLNNKKSNIYRINLIHITHNMHMVIYTVKRREKEKLQTCMCDI
jgi:hypothetical protein